MRFRLIVALLFMSLILVGVVLKKTTNMPALVTIGAAPAATCIAGAMHIDTDPSTDTNCTTDGVNALCVCSTTDTWVTTETEYFEAATNFPTSPAAETTLSLNNFDVMDMDWEESRDRNGCFTTTAAQDHNEVCYTCDDTIRVQTKVHISFDRSAGAGNDVITFAFGAGTTGAIDDGSEYGDHFKRSLSVNSIVGLGSVSATRQFGTGGCISLLAKVDDVTGGSGYTMRGSSLTIIEP